MNATAFDVRMPAALLALATTGCFSTASYHTAEPVEQGTTEMGLAAEVDTITGSDTSDEVVITEPRIHARRGVSETMDVGLAAGSFGAAVDINTVISEGESFTLSLNPYQSLLMSQIFGDDGTGIGRESSTLSTTIVGLLLDLPLSDDVTLTGGLKPGLAVSSVDEPEEDATEAELFAAGSLGMKIDISEGTHLFPEVNIVRGLTGVDETWPDGVIMKFGLGLGF